jgi:hypothetical protein
MIDTIKRYAKGVAGAVGLAATAITPTLPIDSDAQLYVGIASAVAGLVLVVCIPNAKPVDELAAADTAVHEIGTAVVKVVPDAAGFISKLEAIIGNFEGLVALTPVASDTVKHDPVAGSVGDVPPAVVDAPSVPVAAVPADPPPVVADGDPAVAIPDPPVAPVDPPADVLPAAEAEAPAAPQVSVLSGVAEPFTGPPAPASGVDDGVTLPDDVPPPTVGILTS